jgi:ubiquinone/menaquinone biosynthesis C-methylase UbiE
MWWKILYYALKRNGWRHLFFYLSNLDIWRFIEYSQAYNYICGEKDTQTIADLGAGYSIFPSIFSKQNYMVIDIGSGACRYQNKNKTRAILADITRIPLETASISAVIAISSIEHVPDDNAVFSEISRILKANGVAIVSLPFSAQGSKTVTMDHPGWQLFLLQRFSKMWKLILGEIHSQYFREQISTDSQMKYYSLFDLQEILRDKQLYISEYELFGSTLTQRVFNVLPPGWFLLKDLIIGWPLHRIEKRFLKNANATGIVLKIRKNNIQK